MDKAGKKHDYTPVEAASPSSLPLFVASDDAPWTLRGERKLEGDERPEPAFDIAAVDAAGAWLLDRSGSSAGRPEVKSVLRRIDRPCLVVGEKALSHDQQMQRKKIVLSRSGIDVASRERSYSW